MKKIILIRHGQSIYNLENRFTGWKDVDLTEKGIKTIGTDACSIDSPAGHELAPEVLPPAHLVFLGAGIPQIEDLRNLNQLPQIFFVTIAPLKLSRSSGAPTRVFAFV